MGDPKEDGPPGSSFQLGARNWAGNIAAPLDGQDAKVTFTLGMLLGGLAGALLAYVSGYHKH
jgi:hypothetical protein